MERWQIVENFVKTLSDEKERWDLLPWKQLAECVKVMSGDGLKKHSVDDWKDKKPFFRHHTEKLVRHVARFLGGHTYDEDSGFDPLAHVICRALFLLWGNKQQRKS